MVSTLRKSLTMGILVFVCSAMLALTFGVPRAHAESTVSTEQQMTLITKLLEQIQSLQKILAGMQGGTGKAILVNENNGTCLNLKNELGYQSRDIYTNGEVSALQDFMQTNGYLNTAPVGFYGLMTVDAVKRFQSSYGIKATGYVGDYTRSKIKELTCGGRVTVPPVLVDEDIQNIFEFKVLDRKTGKTISPTGNSGIRSGEDVGYVLRASVGADCYVTVGREGEGIRNEKNLLHVTASTAYKSVARYEKTYGPIVKSTYFISGCKFTDGSSENVEVYVRPESMTKTPKITSAELINGHIELTGRNLGSLKKLEYQANCCKPVEGILTDGAFGENDGYKDTVAFFYLDSYLRNTDIQGLEVRVVDVYGNTSNWENARLFDGLMPIVKDASLTQIDGFSQFDPMNLTFNFVIEHWRAGLVMDIEPYVHCGEGADWERYCDKYLFDFSEKAGESYHGVAGDPYVKGGALYRFTGTGTSWGESISIRAYIHPDYIQKPLQVIPYYVNYRFILRDTQNGGAEVWSETFKIVTGV